MHLHVKLNSKFTFIKDVNMAEKKTKLFVLFTYVIGTHQYLGHRCKCIQQLCQVILVVETIDSINQKRFYKFDEIAKQRHTCNQMFQCSILTSSRTASDVCKRVVLLFLTHSYFK